MSFYKAGTISVAANGTAVTGALTAFLQQVKIGDMLIVGTYIGFIQSVNSNTSLTLVNPWAGPAVVSSADYTINHTGTGWSSTKDLNEAVTALIQRFSSAIDGSDSGLSLLADRAIFPEDFGAVGGLSTRDDTAIMQAAINAAQLSGAPLALKPRQTYYFRSVNSLVYDPSRLTLQGNSATFNFAGKTFQDPATSPELAGTGSFSAGGAGWIASGNTSLQPTYAGGQLRFAPPEGVNNYLEIGRKVTAPSGSRIRVSVAMGEIVSHTVGQNTFRDIGISFRKDTGTAAGSIGSGGQAGGANWFLSNNAAEYAPGAVITRDFVISEPNPYIRLQTNAEIKLNGVSVKVIPNNVCILCRVPEGSAGGQLRGHNYREWRNLKISGKPGDPTASFVEAVYFDTPIYPTNDLGQHSRVNWYNVDISDGVGKGLIFNNRTYLSVFTACRIVCAEACVETIPGSADAGENIVFLGGNLGGGKIGIKNTGGFEFNLFGLSIDFSRQWMVGGGAITLYGGHLETNSPTLVGYPLLDCQGMWIIRGTVIQVNGSTVPVLVAPFRSTGFLDIEAKNPYNLHGTDNALCEGDGRFIFVARGGSGKEMDVIGKRDDRHNRLGAGGRFETSRISFDAFIGSSTANARNLDRYRVEYPALGSFTGTVTRGSNLITGVSASPQTGWIITLPGFPSGTTVVSHNATTGTTTVTDTYQKAGQAGVTIPFEFANPPMAVMEISAAQARSGTQSLRIAKGAGVGTSALAAAFLIPMLPGRAVGAEWWWMVPGGGPAGSTTSIFFTSSFVRVTNDGGITPLMSGAEFISDLPQTGIKRDDGVPWSRLSFSTLRVPVGAAHDGYCPDGCTHAAIGLNLASVPSGFEMFIDDMHASIL